MKNKNSIILSTLMCLVLASCARHGNITPSSSDSSSGDSSPSGASQDSSSSSSDVIPPEPLDYEVKDINLIREMNKDTATPIVDKTLSLRFYNETPNIPYIDVSTYFDEFYEHHINKRIKNSLYEYSLDTGEFISFDAEEDTFATLGLRDFDDHPAYVFNSTKYFLKEDVINYTPKSIKVISLKNYDIDVKEDNDEAYLPFSFLAKLAGGLHTYNPQYNGKDIYVIDANGYISGEERSVSYFGDAYYEVLDDVSTPRHEDLIKYNYSELCFVFDNLRGYTSKLIFGDNNLLTLGLNGILEMYYPTVKEYLLSSNKTKYYQGIFALFAGLYDGGHTGLLSGSEELNNATSADVYPTSDEFTYLRNCYSESAANAVIDRAFFGMYRSMVLGVPSSKVQYYVSDTTTSTAYIGFNSFNVDYEAWDKFYKNEGEIPVDTDTYAFIRSKFYQAKQEGIKNVVLDLTTNGGGNSDALEGIVGLLNGAKSYFETNDTVNKYRRTESHLVDINLDGEYNEQDAQELEQFDFNIGVLTSHFSFSCGNLLPSILKELGYKILGERSGGGSCAIIRESTPDGVPYVRSSYLCLSNKQGDNIDEGVEVDFEIERLLYPGSTSLLDLSNFYDFSLVSEYLNTAYSV